MNGRIDRISWTEPAPVDALSAALRAWEPRLDLIVRPGEDRLYDPDDTLYALALTGGSELYTDRRREPIAAGDAVAVPRGLAIDVEPAADFLCVRYSGPPPVHFRERFLQVWGFERFPAPAVEPGSGPGEVIPRVDARHRVPVAVEGLAECGAGTRDTGMDVVVLVGLEGEADIEVSGVGGHVFLGRGTIVALSPGRSYAVRGRGRMGTLTLMAEAAHEARLAADLSGARRAFSPEFPAPGGPD